VDVKEERKRKRNKPRMGKEIRGVIGEVRGDQPNFFFLTKDGKGLERGIKTQKRGEN